MRTKLEQKYHGVPARGIQGIDGAQGAKGVSIYIGFINDFFDYSEYDIDPAVRYTKRKTDILNHTEAWVNYKNQYNNMNVNSMYYTGEFTNVKTAAKDENGNNIDQPMDVVNYNQNLPGQSITADQISVNQIDQYEFQFVQDITYTTATNKQLSYIDVYDFEDPKDNIDERLLATYDPVPAYTVHIDINHITYDYSDLKRIALMKFKKLGEKYPEKYSYNMWDFYTTFDDNGEQIKGVQSEATYKTWLDDPDKYPLFIREELEGKYKEYITGVTAYSGQAYTGYDAYNNPYTNYKVWPLENSNERHYLIMPNNNNPAIDDLTYALTYFKYPVKTFPLYAYGTLEENKDHEQMIDYEGYTYIGINDDSMYEVDDTGAITLKKLNDILLNVRKSNEDTPLIDQTNFTLSDQAPFINTIRDYKVILQNKTSRELIPTNDLVVWHSGTSKLKLPTTLASTINVGDILYFYTNKGQFDNIKNTDTQNAIEYMAIVTEDMIGCTVQELIDKAQVIKPFNYSVFNEVYSEDRAKINRSTIITNMYRNIPDDYDKQGYEHFNIKSAEEILTQNDGGCALRIISGNYIDDMSSAGLLEAIAKNNNAFNTNENLSTLKIYSQKNNKDITNYITTDNHNLIIKNLAVNNTNHKYLNFELTDIVYDKNIKFTNDYFIYDNINAGNIEYELVTTYEGTIGYNFSYTLYKSDILVDITKANEYRIGYIITHNNKIIQHNETYNDSITFTLYVSNIDKLVINKLDDNITAIFNIMFTVTKRTGMTYYSNSSDLILYLNNDAYNNEKPQLIIDTYDVQNQYPYIINDNGVNTEEHNIEFNMPDITVEDYTGIVHDPVKLDITPINNDIIIDSVTFNRQPIINQSISNSWITITKEDNNTFKLEIQDNLPDINVSSTERIKTYKIDDYMQSYCSPDDYTVAPLFKYLKKQKNQIGTIARQIKVAVAYYKKDDDTLYKEYYNITQPGFRDPRVLPKFNIKLVNDYNTLHEINTVENGVLCNQFRTYLDISISDEMQDEAGYGWLRYNDDVTIDFSIKHLNKNSKLLSQKETDYPTLRLAVYNYTPHKIINTSTGEETYQYELNLSGNKHSANFYKIDYYPIDAKYQEYYNINNAIYTTSLLKTKVTSVNINGSNFNILNHNILNNNVCNVDNYKKGLYHDTQIDFKNVPLSLLLDNNQPLRIVIDFEFANPIIAQLFYQFTIINVKVNYKKDNKDYVFNMYNDSDDKSDTLLVDINPISLLTNNLDGNIKPLQTNNVKITATDKDSFVLNTYTMLYNTAAYTPQEVIQLKNIKSPILWPTKDLYNDDVMDIKITPISIKDTLLKLNKIPTYYTYNNEEIINTQQLSSISNIQDLNNQCYLSVFYNADIFHPRFRDDRETFYFNGNELYASKYRQRYITDVGSKNLRPVLFNVGSSLNIRDDEQLKSIDIWNYEYQVKNESEQNIEGNKLYPINKNQIITGTKSLYGNAWRLFENINTPITNPYGPDEALDIKILISKLKERITNISPITKLTHEMQKTELYPDNNGLFRILSWEMKWEYVYECDNSIAHALMVTPFDCLMKYLKTANLDFEYASNQQTQSLYNTHWDNISNLSGNNIIPYNLCYDLSERMGFDIKTNIIHYHMLRKPVISNIDTSDLSPNSFIGYNDYHNYLNTNKKLNDTAAEYNIEAYK